MALAGAGPAPRAVEREGRRVLAALRGPAAFVRLLGSGGPGPVAEAGAFASERTARPLRFDAALVGAFVGRGWLRVDGESRWRLAAAGRAWLEASASRPLRRGKAARAVASGRPRFHEGESPLSWLRQRRGAGGEALISECEFEAGERLRADFTRAGLTPQVTVNWESFHLPRPARRQRGAGETMALGDSALAARQRFAAALGAVGPDISGLLVDVCCMLVGLEEAERTRAWPKRSAKLVLRIGLAQLARHYGLTARRGRRRSHRWGAAGYKPSIDGGGA